VGIVTGRNLAELSRQYFPRRLVWPMWAVSEVAAMATDLAEFVGGAIGFSLLLHVSLLSGMAITAVATCLILSLQQRGFRPVELVIGALIAVISLSYLAEIIVAPPAWGAAVFHTVVPQLTDSDAAMLAVGIVGATVMPHAIYLHSGLTQDRIVPDGAAQRRSLIRFSNRETIAALGLAGIVNAAMILMAAAVFHDGAHRGVGDIVTAYRTLVPLLGGGAAAAFLISLIASGLSSSVVGTMAGQVIMQGFVGFRIPVWIRRFLTMMPAFIVVLMGIDTMHALVMSQVVLSLVLPVPMISLLWLSSRRDVMGRFANNRLTAAAAAAATVVVVALNAAMLIEMSGLATLF
jgi:manganese transport protein